MILIWIHGWLYQWYRWFWLIFLFVFFNLMVTWVILVHISVISHVNKGLISMKMVVISMSLKVLVLNLNVFRMILAFEVSATNAWKWHLGIAVKFVVFPWFQRWFHGCCGYLNILGVGFYGFSGFWCLFRWCWWNVCLWNPAGDFASKFDDMILETLMMNKKM